MYSHTAHCDLFEKKRWSQFMTFKYMGVCVRCPYERCDSRNGERTCFDAQSEVVLVRVHLPQLSAARHPTPFSPSFSSIPGLFNSSRQALSYSECGSGPRTGCKTGPGPGLDRRQDWTRRPWAAVRSYARSRSVVFGLAGGPVLDRLEPVQVQQI